LTQTFDNKKTFVIIKLNPKKVTVRSKILFAYPPEHIGKVEKIFKSYFLIEIITLSSIYFESLTENKNLTVK